MVEETHVSEVYSHLSKPIGLLMVTDSHFLYPERNITTWLLY